MLEKSSVSWYPAATKKALTEHSLSMLVLEKTSYQLAPGSSHLAKDWLGRPPGVGSKLHVSKVYPRQSPGTHSIARQGKREGFKTPIPSYQEALKK